MEVFYIRSVMSSLMGKTFAKFHQKVAKAGESPTSPATTISTSSSVLLVDSNSGPPPPYSEIQRLSDKGEKPTEGLPPVERCVRLCSHETLSFQRTQRILGLPNFRQSSDGIDGLGATTIAQHTRAGPDSLRRCSLRNTGGYVQLRYVSKYFHFCLDLLGYSGIELSSSWSLYPRLDIEEILTRVSLQRHVDELNMFLCPHQRLGDQWFVDRIYSIIRPKELAEDPIDK